MTMVCRTWCYVCCGVGKPVGYHHSSSSSSSSSKKKKYNYTTDPNAGYPNQQVYPNAQYAYPNQQYPYPNQQYTYPNAQYCEPGANVDPNVQSPYQVN